MKTALIAFAAAGLFLTAVLLGAGDPPPKLAPPTTIALKPTPVPGTVPAGEGPAPVPTAPEEPQPASPAPEPQPAAPTGAEGVVVAQPPASAVSTEAPLQLEPQAFSAQQAPAQAEPETQVVGEEQVSADGQIAGEEQVSADGQIAGEGLRLFVNVHVVIHHKGQVKRARPSIHISSHELKKLHVKVKTKHERSRHVVTQGVNTMVKVQVFERKQDPDSRGRRSGR